MPYLTTSRQSPSDDKRKYSSPGRSWHSSSMFCSAFSSSSCLFTRTSAVAVIKRRRTNERVYFLLLSFLFVLCLLFCAFISHFLCACTWMIKGEFITQILISPLVVLFLFFIFFYFSLPPEMQMFLTLLRMKFHSAVTWLGWFRAIRDEL